MEGRSNYLTGLLWLLIAAYVLFLPSAILVFNWFIDQFSLAVARWIPVMVVAALVAVYTGFRVRRGNRFYLWRFLIPCLLIVLSVVLLQPNPIKYIHLPEYALLAIMLWLALRPTDAQSSYAVLLSVFACVVFLGVFDELHQGIHPERYYGWKDMVVNAAGGLIGVLLIKTFLTAEPKPLTLKVSVLIVFTQANTLVLLASLFYLIMVQEAGSFIGVYPLWLLAANVASLVFGLFAFACAEDKLLKVPLSILSLNHTVLALITLFEVSFR